MESVNNISIENLKNIISTANYFKYNKIRNDYCKNIIFGLFFSEPSTRTLLSFESAIYRLGGKCIRYNKLISSEKKGETLLDSIKMMENYVDILIIRHMEDDIIRKIKKIINIPIINAGNGTDEHPTQAITDLFTISQYYTVFQNIPDINGQPDFSVKKFNNYNLKNIAFVGDIKNSRVIHSLIYILSKNPNILFYFISDKHLCPDGKFKEYLDIIENKFFILEDINKIINKIDILYVTRLQNERFKNEKITNNIIINRNILKNSKSSLIIMHPLPRNNELSEELDTDKRSKYFEQAENAVYVRMSIIKYICQKKIKRLLQ